MQLWYGDGFRNINCSRCRKMSRSTHWHCCHGIQWHKCLIHREDPVEHRTIRKLGKFAGSSINAMPLLPSTRPGPAIKRQRVSNSAEFKRKSIIQSANPALYSTDLSKCPRLAAKFPHLYSALQSDECEPCMYQQNDICMQEPVTCEGVSDTTSNQQSASSESAPAVVVQPARRGFRYPLRGAATGSSSHRSFLPKGVFGKEGGCADGSHYREDDQRSDL